MDTSPIRKNKKCMCRKKKRREDNLPIEQGVMNSHDRFYTAFVASFTKAEHTTSFFDQSVQKQLRWTEIITRHQIVSRLHTRTHIKLPMDMYWLKNLVTRRRAPASVHDGIIFFGFSRSSHFFPSKPWAAAFPACWFNMTNRNGPHITSSCQMHSHYAIETKSVYARVVYTVPIDE